MVPDNAKHLCRKLTSLAKDTLKDRFENYILWGNNLYSKMRVTDDVEAQVEHDGQNYTVKISWAKEIT